MKEKILVVEDSLTQALRLQYLLQENGYDVRVASDGVKGLAAAKEEKPAIIITDVVMPEMNGYELCCKIKKDETLKDIHVVLLTSLTDPRDVIKGLQCGADNFLTKPYDNEQLLRRVHHILVNMEMRKEGNAQMSVEVFFGGQRHTLTPDRVQIIDLLLSTFELAVLQSTHLEKVSADYRNALEDVKRAETNLRTIMDMTGDAIIVVDSRQLVRYVNPAAETIFGRKIVEILHKPFDIPMEVGRQEITIKCPGGKRLVADMRVVNSKWDGENVRLATIRDITETVMLREQLRTESITDSLTGLYNFRGLMKLGEKQLNLASQMKKQVLCLFADLDEFKIINDMFGHKEGNKVLQEVAQIFKEVFRESDLIARVGGDEFVVLAIMSKEDSSEELVARLQKNIEMYNANTCRSYTIGMSIGTKFSNLEVPSSITELMSGADKLMYDQKIIRKIR